MKLLKSSLSIMLSLCLIFSILCVGSIETSAVEYETYAQESVQGGAILHCFNWSYNNIKAALPDIARAGYTAVQTSPVQRPKDYNSSWTDMVNQWWKMYQPLGFSIANGNTWLGTKAELTSLCTEAEKYGIKVVVDIVANHLANNGTSGGTFSLLHPDVDSGLKNANFYHTSNNGTNDNSRYNMTQYHLGMPDLNTANTQIQQRALGLLEECIDCGVDGFRFDAAKHIELPTDPSNCRSNFWPYVIDGAKNYASDNDKPEPFFYGEILGSAGTDISNYTTYMAVTENVTGDRALDKAYWVAASELADGNYDKGASADKSVLWVESHDTYMGKSGSAWTANTKDVTSDVIIKAWAIVGARADSTSLYFARPNSTMGAASTDTTWKSTAVAEVNKFKNYFDGTNEYLASSGNTAYIERGTKGVVISKLDGGGSVNLTAHQMANGTYKDQITNSTFTVVNGKITGTVGSTGVAVVYNADKPAYDTIENNTLYLKPNSTWTNGNARFAMYLFNIASGTNEWVSMTDPDGDGYYSADVPSGDWTNVIFCRMNPSTTENNWNNKEYQTEDLYPDSGCDCYTITTLNGNEKYDGNWSVYSVQGTTQQETTQPATQPATSPTETGPDTDTYTLYAYNQNGWSNMKVYYWGTSTDPQWPGIAMTQGSKVFKAEVPKGVDGVIFNNGALQYTQQTVNIESGISNNAQFVVTNTTDSSGHYNVETGPSYYLVGSMNGWSNNDAYKFSLNTENTDNVEYKLSGVQLSAGATLKIHDSKNAWYPDGMNNDYEVDAAGTYDVYFRPNGDGNEDWHNGYFKLVNVTPCAVTWEDGDGNTLKTDTVTYGDTPEYTGDTPTKEPTAQYTYTFSGWSPEVAAVTGNVTYTAQFTESLRTFTVTWKNYDGTVIETDENVAYGSKPTYNSDTPTREADGNTTYAFSGWSPQINDETTITEDATYIARFGTNTHTYTITWKDGDGNILRTEPCIEGVTPHYTGDTPTKTADAQYTYTFNNTWNPPLVAADRDTEYTAQFDTTVNEYDVTWKNHDGTILKTEKVKYGETPAYTGETPTKPSTFLKKYTFSGWSPEVVDVTGTAEYTAQFTENDVDKYNITVTNAIGWDKVNVYCWLGDENNSWPGVEMTAVSDGLTYTAEIPATAEGVIFNDGAAQNTQQTDNITTGIKDGAHWVVYNNKNNISVKNAQDYYLVGSMNEWTDSSEYKLTPIKNENGYEEYKLSGVELAKNAQLKIHSGDTWYPDGYDNNYVVSAEGTYDVYFRPNGEGNADWYERYFYLVNVTPYNVTWEDGDGNTLKTDIVYHGNMPEYSGETPTKSATAQYTYVFNDKWSPAVTEATGNVTYKAQFDSIVNKYNIKFVDEDGTELQSSEVEYGTTPAYTGETPAKAADEQYTYTFAGWTPEVEAVKGDATYTATYDAEVKEDAGKISVDEYKQNGTYPKQAGKVFAGWYEDEDFNTPFNGDTGEAYARFVDKDIYTVKYQYSENTTLDSETTDIRFITTTDDLKYKAVGFYLYYNGQEYKSPQITNVYKKIKGGDNEYTPKTFSQDSNWFVTFSIWNIPKCVFDGEFTVQAYWITQDDTEVVGESRPFKISDDLNKTNDNT